MAEVLQRIQGHHWLREMATNARTKALSTKRGTLIAATVVLLLIAILVGYACAWWIALHGDLGWGAVFALLSIVATVAALAGSAYRKPELPFHPLSPRATGAEGSAPVGPSGLEQP